MHPPPCTEGETLFNGSCVPTHLVDNDFVSHLLAVIMTFINNMRNWVAAGRDAPRPTLVLPLPPTDVPNGPPAGIIAPPSPLPLPAPGTFPNWPTTPTTPPATTTFPNWPAQPTIKPPGRFDDLVNVNAALVRARFRR
jgi:hypothetical protein